MKWYIEITDDNRDIIEKWLKDNNKGELPYFYNDNTNYIGFTRYLEGRAVKSNYFIYNKCIKIDTELFIKINNITIIKIDYSYLLPLLININ